ncbi:MAG: hypothetical protein ILP16_08855, partial [Spirochaetales bacterium]|nr:hypothetical protein [Spirochaetales bacterium]
MQYMTKIREARTALVVLFALMLLVTPMYLGASGISEAFTCQDAAKMLSVNADAYFDSAPTVEFILGDALPEVPLTRLVGCEMLLRAFGPLPDVQEGVRYYAKYRDCAFTDVPEEGRAAVENLTNAGLYIPKDNSHFGPNELMTEKELSLLVDRIHAYLQTSPKDDFYSYATADLLNDPYFLDVPYDTFFFEQNNQDSGKFRDWMIDMFNDCLENPTSPEKANIAAFISTYMDQDSRENSMAFIQPMVDAIWNAPDFDSLVEVCADISSQTGVDVLLAGEVWNNWKRTTIFENEEKRLYECLNMNYLAGGVDPEEYLPGHYTYQAGLEQTSRLLSYLGFDRSEAELLVSDYYSDFRYNAQIQYNESSLPKTTVLIKGDDSPEELSFFHLAEYLEHAGYENNKSVVFSNYADTVLSLSLFSRPEYLNSAKIRVTRLLINSFISVVPLHVRDAALGYWGDYFAAYPSLIYTLDTMVYQVCPLIQTDMFKYYSKMEEYKEWYERLDSLCRSIIADYRLMLENVSWISESTRKAAIDKLDSIEFELLIPKDLSGMIQVEYASAEDGGTLFENTIRYVKARRHWIESQMSVPSTQSIWTYFNTWLLNLFYTRNYNKFFLCMGSFISSLIERNSSDEEVMGIIGFFIAHEISHAFDWGGSYYNGRGEMEDWWTEADRREFEARCERLA